MEPGAWVPVGARSVLDVGCNAGDLLAGLQVTHRDARLVGIDVNGDQIAKARKRLPGIEFHHGSGHALPFQEGEFDCVTCIEVLEHVPSEYRSATLREIHRVLRVGGRLVLRVPHAGMFAWMDANNLRFRFPAIYRAVLGHGRRDAGYTDGGNGVVWHHHFSEAELMSLLGPRWRVESRRTGALFLYPLMDLLCWPFYRVRRIDNPVFGALQRVAAFDMNRDYGSLSYNILLTLVRL